MELTLERFDPAVHDAESVARLIYQADPSLMRFVLGEETEAVPVITRLVGMKHNDYSGRHVICAQHGVETVGVMVGLTGATRRESKKSRGKDWGRALGMRGMFRAMRYAAKLESVATTEIRDDEYYISALTVDEQHRGRGIGSRLLSEVFWKHDVVVVDVNTAKGAAIRFYERHGFVIQKEMTFLHEGKRLGNYQMRRVA